MKHYDDGKFDRFEEKTNYISQSGNILTYKILVQKHKDYYDFDNSEELVDNFLKTVRSKFMPRHFLVRQCGFSIENYQPGPTENNTPMINTRYWFTEPYKTKFFDDYIFLSFKENIRIFSRQSL